MFEDDYNYSQHLKTRGGEGADIYEADPKAVAKMENALEEKAKGLGIPSDLLPSEYEEEVGMLNLAAYVFLFFFPVPPPSLSSIPPSKDIGAWSIFNPYACVQTLANSLKGTKNNVESLRSTSFF